MKAIFKIKRVFPTSFRGLLRTTATCLLCSREFELVREQSVATFLIDEEVVAHVCEHCTRKQASQASPRIGGDEVAQ